MESLSRATRNLSRHLRPVERPGYVTLDKWKRIACRMRTSHAAYIFGVNRQVVNTWKRRQDAYSRRAA